MEDFAQKWFDLEQVLKERFGKVPDLEGILFLVGMNEIGAPPVAKYTKEQKQDLMHIAVCTLLSTRGYFEYTGHDSDGWPHFEPIKPVEATGLKEQEMILKECIITYFE